MKPREISAEMLREMKTAAREAFKRHAADVPREDLEEWAKLCKRHCANALAKEWGD